MPFPDSPFRRRAVAAALVLGPVFFVVQSLLQPALDGTPAEQLASIAAHPLAAKLSVVAFALSQLALLVAALGLMELLRVRAARLGTVGGALAVVGSFGHVYVGGTMATTLTLAEPRFAGPDAAKIFDAARNAWPFLAFAGPSLLCFLAGWIVLTVALWRSRVVPRLVPGALFAALALDFVVSSAAPKASVAAGVVLLAGLAAVARQFVAGPRPAPEPVGVAA